MKKSHKEERLSLTLPDEEAGKAKTIRRVVWIGCAVNALLMALKLTVGWFGHSDALFADGFHSLNDLAADIIMLTFVGISYRPADRRFAYGYGKFETFSSFLISTFLILVAVMIGYEGIESIVSFANGEVLPQPSFAAFVVVLFAMACKEGLFRFYSYAGRKADSNALLANAWHHRSDALASVATLIGVSCAHFFGPSFRILDPIASLVISLFILVPAVRLMVPAFLELMDRSLPAADVDRARRRIEAVNGVERIEYLRTRRNGHHLIFDIALAVSPQLSIGECENIRREIVASLEQEFCRHIVVSVVTLPDF